MQGNGDEHNLRRVTAALDAAGARLDCQSCGKTEWDRQADPVILLSARGGGDVTPAFPAQMFVCRNCGLVRLHNLEVLLGE